MKILIVHAHPNPESFSAALFSLSTDTLRRQGHQVQTIDLYAENFDPVMSLEERQAYLECPGWLVDRFQDHIEKIKEAEALILVYPTWWNGMPAMMKGWFDRVWLPVLTFEPAKKKGAMAQSHMTHIRNFAVITHGGSPGWWLKLIGDPHRKMMMRAVRVLFSWRCRSRWLRLNDMNTVTEHDRSTFLARVNKFLLTYEARL